MEKLVEDPETHERLKRTVRGCVLCVRETNHYCHTCRQFLCPSAPVGSTYRACCVEFHALRHLPLKKRSISKRSYTMRDGEKELRSKRAIDLVASKKSSGRGTSSSTLQPGGSIGPQTSTNRGRGRPRKRPDDTTAATGSRT